MSSTVPTEAVRPRAGAALRTAAGLLCRGLTARRLSTAGLLAAVLAPAAAAQRDTTVRPEDDPSGKLPTPAETLVVPDGLEVTLVAESPLLYNPTAMDVDARGRLWVTEAVNYRRWNGRNPGRYHDEGDRVVILEDQDGDGTYESSKVFVQEPELVSPLGIAVLGRQVFVSNSPDLIVYTDADGDDVPDSREVFLTGFGGPDHDHGLHSVVAGPDGYLYIAVGNAGPHIVTDKAGWSLRSGSLYTGGGQFLADNKPGLVSSDGRLWTGGLILRVRPDGTGLEVLAHNFRNNYEVALDAFGNLYQSDNDDDGNQGCRVLWCLEGGNHGYFSADGSRSWGADRRPGQDTQTAHWHQDDPGVVPYGTITGAGGPTGVAVYEAELLAPWIDGHVLAADAGAGVVYAMPTRPEGAAIHLPMEPVRRTEGDAGPPRDGTLIGARGGVDSRGARWFRPSDVVVDVDGSVLVADWYDPGVGGHAAGDRATYGRILRIAPRGHMRVVPLMNPRTMEGALAALDAPAVNTRRPALDALTAAGSPAIDQLSLAAMSGEDLRRRARALQALVPHGVKAATVLPIFLEDASPAIRVTAVRVARQILADERPGQLREYLAPRAKDSSAAVRREVALALRGVPWVACREQLLDLSLALDPRDRVMLEALGLAAEGKEAALLDALATKFGLDRPVPEDMREELGVPPEGDIPYPTVWDPRLEALAWRLHPPEVVPWFEARARDTEVDRASRARLIDALAFVETRRAAESMLSLALTGPADTRDLARWWFEHRLTNDWAGYGFEESLQARGAEVATPVWTSPVVQRGEVAVDVDVTGGRTLWLVVQNGGNGNACDWADWLEPRVETDSGVVDLTEVEWLSAEAEWGEVRRGRNCAGGPLSVGGVTHEKGLGTHARSLVAFALPADARRFKARAAVDDGGTSQSNGQATSVVFEVRVEQAPSTERLAAWEAELRDTMLEDEVRFDAALALAEDEDGAVRLLDLASRGVLADWDAGDLDELGEALGRHPDHAVRALATEHFPRAGREGDLPSVSELLALEGDPVRGRDVFLDPATQCVTCHAMTRAGVRRGGDVGPELTAIRTKYGDAELLDAILNPNAGIAFGYDSYTWRLASGEVFTGFPLADDGVRLVLKDTRGQRHVLPSEEVVERRKSTVSTMPEGLAAGLDAQDLADLVAFLREDPFEPLERGEPVELFDGRDLLGWTYHLDDPNALPAEVWTVERGVLRCEGVPTGYLRTTHAYTNFELRLKWRFDPERGAGNSGVLLRVVGEDRVWPRSIEAQLHGGDAGDIWNIGAFGMIPEAARTDGRRTTRAQPSSERPLGEWNEYRIVVDRGRLTLEVNGVLQNAAAWCDEVPGFIALQSEGAYIEFKDIVLTPLTRP